MKKDTKLNDFIGKVEQFLSSMSVEEKDSWIITQAKLTRSEKDFLKSLSGEKKIQFMPSEREIKDFCQKIENEEIYLLYETHYVEFDEFGYCDDFDEVFHDPFGISSFFDSVLLSCHDLMKLGEYQEVQKNILLLVSLEVCIAEHDESEDIYQGDYPFTITEFFRNDLLAIERKNVVYDLIMSYYQLNKAGDITHLAGEIIKRFSLPLCEDILPSDIFSENEIQYLFTEMASILRSDITSLSKVVKKENFDRWRGENNKLVERYERNNRLLEDIKRI